MSNLDALFGDDKVLEEVIEVPIDQVHYNKNHPFTINWDKVKEYAESMKDVGQIVPALIRKDPELPGDELIAGHHRYEAIKLNGGRVINCIYRDDLSDEEIMLVMVDSNIPRFNDLKLSERARVVHERQEALSKQGIRTDLIQEVADMEKEMASESYSSSDQIKEEFKISAREISRYLRIYKLVDLLKEALDNDIIKKRVAVDLSYIDDKNQMYIAEKILSGKYKIDMKKSDILKKHAKEGILTEEIILDVLKSKKVVNSKPVQKVEIAKDIYYMYFTKETKDDEVNSVIEKALKMYYASTDEKSYDVG